MEKNLLLDKAIQIFKQVSPIKSGWLRANIEGELTEDGFILFIDDVKVPYVKYTLKKGETNPNQGWDEQSAELFALILKQVLSANYGNLNESEEQNQ